MQDARKADITSLPSFGYNACRSAAEGNAASLDALKKLSFSLVPLFEMRYHFDLVRHRQLAICLDRHPTGRFHQYPVSGVSKAKVQRQQCAPCNPVIINPNTFLSCGLGLILFGTCAVRVPIAKEAERRVTFAGKNVHKSWILLSVRIAPCVQIIRYIVARVFD